MTPNFDLYRLPMSDEDIEAMNARTEERRQAAIRALGPKWLGYVAPKTVEPKSARALRAVKQG